MSLATLDLHAAPARKIMVCYVVKKDVTAEHSLYDVHSETFWYYRLLNSRVAHSCFGVIVP